MDYPSDLQDRISYRNTLNKEVTRLNRLIIKEQAKFLYKEKKTYVLTRLGIILSLLAILIIAPLFYFTWEPPYKTIQKIETIFLPDTNKTHVDFLYDLAIRESGNDYTKVNQFGYMGKYQFGQSALQTVGLNVSKDLFLSTPQLQEAAMTLLLKYNKRVLATYIGKHSGTYVKDIYITESGLLAGAHLGGPGNVIKFLESKGNEDFKDGNGVPISSYIKKYTGYKLVYK